MLAGAYRTRVDGSSGQGAMWLRSSRSARRRCHGREAILFEVAVRAEQLDRVRTLRDRQRASGQPLHESAAAAIEELRAEGVARAELEALARRLEVHPVLTAHPSEARRRTLLHHLQAAAGSIDQLDD